MTAERRAVLLLLGLAVAGQGIRMWRSAPGEAPGAVALLPSLPTGTPRAHRDSSIALTRPLAPGERIDLDRASPVEVARLPRVGIALARKIVADREQRGPFGSLEALDRVPGIGPGLIRIIAPHAAFSAPRRPESSIAEWGSAISAPSEAEARAELPSRRPPESLLLDLNTATIAELEHLPHIGPALAERIVAYRTRHGPFPSVESLVRVPGVGPGILSRIRPRLRI